MKTEERIILDLTPASQIAAEISKEFGAIVAYNITDESGCSFAIETVKKIKAKATFLEAQRKGITAPLDAAKKAIMDLYRGPAEQLERAERVIKHALLCFQQEAERKRLEAQRIAEERARKEEEERRRELAEQAEADLDAGRTIAAMEKVERANEVFVMAEVIPALPKVSGLQTRGKWKHRVVDASLVPREFMIPDDKTLAGLATSRKDKAQVPGVEFYEDKSVAITNR
jgi:hypothetical protein